MKKLSDAARKKKNEYMKKRRDERRAKRICINQPDRGPPHGRVVKGGRCQKCCDVHAETA